MILMETKFIDYKCLQMKSGILVDLSPRPLTACQVDRPKCTTLTKCPPSLAFTDLAERPGSFPRQSSRICAVKSARQLRHCHLGLQPWMAFMDGFLPSFRCFVERTIYIYIYILYIYVYMYPIYICIYMYIYIYIYIYICVYI